VTSKYTVPNLSSPRYTKKRARNQASKDRKPAAAEGGDSGNASEVTSAPKVPRAYLVLKTYDPESGVTLKYRTDEAREVGKLIASLGGLGRYMAALPEISEDVPMPDATGGAAAAEHTTEQQQTKTAAVVRETTAPVKDSKAEGGGTIKKKKKGKR